MLVSLVRSRPALVATGRAHEILDMVDIVVLYSAEIPIPTRSEINVGAMPYLFVCLASLTQPSTIISIHMSKKKQW
jgi:hypothetical protein